MTKSKMTIAITGATGFLGSKLVDHLLEQGFHVIGLVRDPSKQTKKHQRLYYRQYDITKPLNDNTLKDCDSLVHAAYIKHSTTHPNALQLNVEGAKNLISASNKSKVSQMLFISTMSAHDDAISEYGRQKLKIEKLFLDTKKATIFRCGLIIGNGGIVREMASFIKSKHAVPLIGGGNQPLQIISVDNLCQAVENAIDKKLFGHYVVAHPTVYKYKDFYKALASALGVAVAYIPVPYWALQAVFKTASALHIPLGVGEDNLKGLKKLIEMPSRKDLDTLGIDTMGLKEALSKTQL